VTDNNFNDRPQKNERENSIVYVRSLINQAYKNGDSKDIPKLENLIRLLEAKKYGLVWEKHTEKVEEKMKNNIPVFVEKKDRNIKDKPDTNIFNFLLEGDNLHSLHLLEKTHSKSIDVIYIDPPYNTGTKKGAFKYNDKLVVKEDSYIHSKWLSFMSVRLRIAKKLLTEKGVLFVHIDENEYAQLKLLLDEIFGEKSFVENLIWNKRVPKNDKGIGGIHEYVLIYSQSSNKFKVDKDGLNKIFSLVKEAKRSGKTPLEAQQLLKSFYRKNNFPRAITLYNNVDNNFNVFGKINMSWPNANTFGPTYDVLHPLTLKPVKIPARGWRWKKDTLKKAMKGDFQKLGDGSYLQGKIWFAKNERTQISSINYLKNTSKMLLKSIISLKSDGSLELEKLGFSKNIFPYAKPVSLAKILIDSITFDNKDATILDFFAGSGTTGQAVVELNSEDGGNRKFILATNNENGIAENVTYERMKKISSGTTKYDAHPINLKYFKTDFVDKSEFPDVSLEYELLKHVTPLVELQFGTDITNPKVQIVLNEKQLGSLIDKKQLISNSTLFMSPDVFLDVKQNQFLRDLKIKVQDIPSYFFGKELWSK